jgi:hypothetical protein
MKMEKDGYYFALIGQLVSAKILPKGESRFYKAKGNYW